MSWEIIAHVQGSNTYSFTSVRQQLSFECLRELEQLRLKGWSPKPVVVVNTFAQQQADSSERPESVSSAAASDAK